MKDIEIWRQLAMSEGVAPKLREEARNALAGERYAAEAIERQINPPYICAKEWPEWLAESVELPAAEEPTVIEVQTWINQIHSGILEVQAAEDRIAAEAKQRTGTGE